MRLKKKLAFNLLSVIVIVALLILQQFSPAEPSPTLGSTDDRGFEQALVAEVIDGDTIKLADGRTVRYIGIDTPETKHPTVGQECFGQAASDFNQQLVEGEVVQLEKDVNDTDRYGRLLRYVWLGDELVNQTLVEQGFATARSYPPDVARQEQLRLAEATARSNDRGLWIACYLEE